MSKRVVNIDRAENLEKKGEVKNEEKNNSFYRQQKNLSNYLTSKEEKVKQAISEGKSKEEIRRLIISLNQIEWKLDSLDDFRY